MRSEYTEEFEAFAEAHAREIYLFESGRKARLDFEPVFDRYGYLFEPGEIAEIREAEEAAYTERDRKGLRFLRDGAVERHLDAAARPLAEGIAAHGARATVALGGRDVPFRATRAMLADEPRAGARHE